MLMGTTGVTVKRVIVLLAALAVAAVVATSAGARSTGSCRIGFFLNGQYYHGLVTKSIRTSCPFARNVAKRSLRFIIRHGGAGNGDFYVFVWSPVTQRWYRTHCFAGGDLYGSGVHADCRAGVGARVVYHAHGGSGW